MMLGVFGVAGVGKTTLVGQFVRRNPDYKALRASDLISRSGGVVDFDELNDKAVVYNQIVLAEAVERIRSTEVANFVIELHTVIESSSGLIDIPNGVFQRIGLDACFYLVGSPDVILRQRRVDVSRKFRRTDGENYIESVQSHSLALFRKLVDDLQLPWMVANCNGDELVDLELFVSRLKSDS